MVLAILNRFLNSQKRDPLNESFKLRELLSIGIFGKVKGEVSS